MGLTMSSPSSSIGTAATASPITLAALLLPGLAALTSGLSGTALAETPPEKASVSVRYGDYEDRHPGWDRIKVRSPQVHLLTPVAGEWAVEGTLVGDSVSGASPRIHTQRSGASQMSDSRRAADMKVTRYLSRAAVSVSVGYSGEHDYVSKSWGLQTHWSSEDQNTTWTLGTGGAYDRIDNTASGGIAANRNRHTLEFLGGVTQVLTPVDIVQFNITRSLGNGYYADPYKQFDQRPGSRNAWVLLGRWNHHVEGVDGTLRSSWRYYRDSFGVGAHTLGAEWVQPVGSWTLTPGVRYYTQGAAGFYFDPVLNAQGEVNTTATLLRAIGLKGDKSADPRLSAFGAVTLSLKVAYAFNADTTADVKIEKYRQSAGLRWGGGGSPGLEPLNARLLQVGLTRKF